MENIFEKLHVFLEPIEKGSQNHIVEWKFTDPSMKSKISTVEATCGCSAALMTPTGVVASFNEQDVVNWDETTLNQNKAIYPDGYVTDKSVTVYLNDGEDRFIKRPDGGSYNNPKKQKMSLTFSTYVKL